MKLNRIIIIAFAVLTVSCAAESDAVSETNETLRTIHSRKSVRSFSPKTVDRDILIEIIKAGMAAPSAVDRRPWEFIIVEDRATLNKMAEGLPFAKMLKESPAAIVVCGNMDRDMGGSSYWYFDCSAATQNILLATEALGLGAVWTAVYPVEKRMNIVKEAVNLPDHIGALCVIPIGYPRGKEKPKDKYDAAKIHIEKW